MLKDTKTISYAILALKHLREAKHCDTATMATAVGVRIRDLGEGQVSSSYMVKVLGRMSKAGLISADRHGYRLAGRYEDITLADVMAICEGAKANPILAPFESALAECARNLRVAELVQ